MGMAFFCERHPSFGRSVLPAVLILLVAGLKPVLVSSSPVWDGRYRTEGFQFAMAGDWVLTAQVSLSGGEKIERTFPIDGVAAK